MKEVYTRFRSWVAGLPRSQRRVLLAGFFTLVVASLIHNPLSGYEDVGDWEDWATLNPVGDAYGVFDLGFFSVYVSFVVAIATMTGVGFWLAGLSGKREGDD